MFSTWSMLSTVSSNQGTHLTGQIYQPQQKPHKLLETITLTVILNHQSRSTELIEKLDSNVTEMNYTALNELLGFPGGSDGKKLSSVQET